MKKIIFSLSLMFGLLAGASALAAAYVPPAGQTITSVSAQSGAMMLGDSQAKMTMPCAMMQTDNVMVMKGQMPCGNVMFQSFSGDFGFSHEAAWLGLMLVITVIMVWVVLLLLIALLWKQVCKHKHQ